MSRWRSQFANDPRRGHELYLELLLDETYVGRIERSGEGDLVVIFDCPAKTRCPVPWLTEQIQRAETLPAVPSCPTTGELANELEKGLVERALLHASLSPRRKSVDWFGSVAAAPNTSC